MAKKYVIIPVDTSIDDYYEDIQRQADARSHNYGTPRFKETAYSQAELSQHNMYASQAGGDFADARTVTVSNNVDQSTYDDPQSAQYAQGGSLPGGCVLIGLALIGVAACILIYTLFMA